MASKQVRNPVAFEQRKYLLIAAEFGFLLYILHCTFYRLEEYSRGEIVYLWRFNEDSSLLKYEVSF